MIKVGNSKSDRFFQNIYGNKVGWFVVQILGALSSVYLIQNPAKRTLDILSVILTKPFDFQMFLTFLTVCAGILVMLAYLLLILFFLIPKNFIDLRDRIFTITLIPLIPHSWTTSNSNLVSVSQIPLVNYVFYALPVIVLAMNLHKSASQKSMEVAQ